MSELTVTVKYGKGYEETWAVFKGQNDEVRENIINYFGLDRASVADLTLSDLVVNVTSLAHGKGNVGAILGGVVIDPKKADEAQQPSGTSSDPWAGVESGDATPEQTGPHPLLAQIEACTTRDELKRLWAENQEAFADADLMAAWKAKGKSLTA